MAFLTVVLTIKTQVLAKVLEQLRSSENEKGEEGGKRLLILFILCSVVR